MFALVGKVVDEIFKTFFSGLFWIVVIGFGIGFDWLIWLFLASLVLPPLLSALACIFKALEYTLEALAYLLEALDRSLEARAAQPR